MKKIINTILLAVLILFNASVQAEVLPHKIYALSNQDIKTELLKPNYELEISAIEQYQISDTEYLEENSKIKVKVLEYIEPKRGKRDGYLKVQIISFSIPSQNDRIKDITENNISGKLKLTTKKDMKEVAKSAGISLAGAVLEVPLLSQAVAFTKGLVKPNENQTRLKSAGTNLYKSTPLVYGEKGKDITISKNALLVLKVKSHDDDTSDEYEDIEE